MKKVSTYHSRRPQLLTFQIRPDRLTLPRSTANTPSWQVTLDSSNTMVLMVASLRSRVAPGHGLPMPLSTDRIVKYMANSPAKNMSSDDNQMIVPTLTRFGLVAGERGPASVVAVATRLLLRHRVGGRRPTPQVGNIQFHEGRCVQPWCRHPGQDQARDWPPTRA